MLHTLSLLCCCNSVEISLSFHKARIALLEGERRSFENTRNDLLRRIKMLEFALRMERYADSPEFCINDACRSLTRPLSQVKTAESTVRSIRCSKQGDCASKSIQSFLKQGRDWKPKGGSSGSSPRSEGTRRVIVFSCYICLSFFHFRCTSPF